MNTRMDITRRDLLIKIAKMYYIDEMTQQQIANVLEISRSNVSKYLRMSKEENIVKISINDTSSNAIKYQEFLQTQFRLKKVIIVGSETNIETTKTKVGTAAAELLHSILEPRMSIGLTIGTTVYSVVQQLKPLSEQMELNVVGLMGGSGTLDLDIEGYDIAITLARKLKSSLNILQTPSIVKDSNLKKMLLKEPEIQRVFTLAEHIDIALFGVGVISYEDTHYYKNGYLTREELSRMIADGASAMLCGKLIKEDGSIFNSEIHQRVIGIELDKLKTVPHRLCVAAGRNKAIPLLSALRGNYIDYLVIDEEAAVQMMSLLKYYES